MRIQMKSLLLMIVFVVIIGAQLVLSSEQPLPVTIASSTNAVSVGSGIYKSGSPIFLIVNVTNNSTKTLYVPSFDLDCYSISIWDESGKMVQKLDQTQKTREAKGTSANLGRRLNAGVTGEVKPGSVWKDVIEASAFGDMKKPGKYTIQLERRFPEEIGKGYTKSNAIIVTVIP
jgi:hypothetical protein